MASCVGGGRSTDRDRKRLTELVQSAASVLGCSLDSFEVSHIFIFVILYDLFCFLRMLPLEHCNDKQNSNPKTFPKLPGAITFPKKPIGRVLEGAELCAEES